MTPRGKLRFYRDKADKFRWQVIDVFDLDKDNKTDDMVAASHRGWEKPEDRNANADLILGCRWVIVEDD